MWRYRIAFEPDCGHVHFTPLGVGSVCRYCSQPIHDWQIGNVSWRDLLTLDFITSSDRQPSGWMLEEQLTRTKVERNWKWRWKAINWLRLGRRLVANGLGGSAVPALCRRQMSELGAVCLELDNPVIERRVGVLRLSHHKPLRRAGVDETLKNL